MGEETEAFIRAMAADASGEGVRHLACALDSFDEKLTDASELKSFFHELAQRSEEEPQASWQTVWWKVCFPIGPTGEPIPSPRFARKPTVRCREPAGKRLYHTIEGSKWLAYHYNSAIEEHNYRRIFKIRARRRVFTTRCGF